MDLAKHQNILVIRLSSLGDVILTTPLIRSIKNTYPGIKLDFIVREEYKDAIILNPHLERVYTLESDNDYDKLYDKIGKEKYDLIIDLQNNLRSRIIAGKLGAKTLKYEKPYLKRLLLVKLKINMLEDAPSIPERYAGVVNGEILDEDGPEIFLPDGYEVKLDDSDNQIGICAGSKHFTKMYPVEYASELISLLQQKGYKIVLFGGADDIGICKQIEELQPGVENLCNENDLLQTAAEMQKCKIVICNDSGLMHAAAAVKVPVAAIFGSTVSEFGFAPYKSKHILIENNSIDCRPCSHIGRSKCPKDHFNCMHELTPSYVLNKIENFIGEI